MGRCATWRSTRTRCSSPPPTRGSWRSTRARARRCGTRRSPIAPKGYNNTNGPIIARGKVIQGLTGCTRYGPDGCFISAYDANTGKQLWKFYTVAQTGEPGGDTWGKLPEQFPRGRRDVDHRQLRSRPEPDLLGHRAGEAVGAGQPRDEVHRPGALHELDRRPQSRRRHARVALPARAGRIARSRRSVRARARGRRRSEARVHDRQARHPLEARSEDRRVPRLQGNDVPERLRVDRSEDRRRPTGPTSSSRRPASGAGVSEHRGRPQLAGDELPPADGPADHSAQPVVHGDVGPEGGVHERLRRHGGGSPLLRDARHRRQRRQARRLRRQDDEGSLEPAAARAVPDRRAVDRPAASRSSAISTAGSGPST